MRAIVKNILLASLLFSIAVLSGCHHYDDGPLVSLRSKYNRIQFDRPLTYYTVDGADSLQWFLKLYQDSVPLFAGTFEFQYEPGEEGQWITNGKSDPDILGGWYEDGKLERVRIILPYMPFDMGYGEVLKLSHNAFWLRAIGGGKVREFHFES
jgi:hypothetical protein